MASSISSLAPNERIHVLMSFRRNLINMDFEKVVYYMDTYYDIMDVNYHKNHDQYSPFQFADHCNDLPSGTFQMKFDQYKLYSN